MAAAQSPSRHIPADVVTLEDHARHAQACLPEATWAYLSGGAADELTLRTNRQAWSDWQLHPRVLKPLQGAHLRTTLLGRALAHPILLAPVAAHQLAHPDGEIGVAYAAAAQAAGLILSTQASTRLEAVSQAYLGEPDHGPLWMQLYLQADRGATLALVQLAEAAGYEALVVTVDAPTHGARDRERRAQFQMPAGMQVNLDAPALPAQASAAWDTLMAQAPTWSDIAWLQTQTRLPILLKGVLHEDDARQAQQLGVQGLIVSNHGGRTLDTAVSTAWALPRIADAVGHDLCLLVDGGIRRGTDVLKALALGAQAVLIGRPYVYALATAGALGVAHVLRLLQDELAIAMALCGCPTVADIHRGLLVRP
jgi:4-hydroxymandelate oxidase